MASNSPLAPLFAADRLAIVGASDRNHYAVNIFKNLPNMGFDTARIVPINPGRPEVFGLKAYPSILDVPGDIPLAVIAVNPQRVVEEVCKKRGKAGVIFADGFAEGGDEGKKLQQQLIVEVYAAWASSSFAMASTDRST